MATPRRIDDEIRRRLEESRRDANITPEPYSPEPAGFGASEEPAPITHEEPKSSEVNNGVPSAVTPYGPPSSIPYEPELFVQPGPTPAPVAILGPTINGVPGNVPREVEEAPATQQLESIPQAPLIDPKVISVTPPIVPTVGLSGAPIFCKDFSLDLSGTSLPRPFGTTSDVTLGTRGLTGVFEIVQESPPPTRYVQGCKLTIFPFDCERIPCIDDASDCGGAVRSHVNPANPKELIYTTHDTIEIMYKVEGKGRDGKMLVIPLHSGPMVSAVAFAMDINSDEGKHCARWPLVVAPARIGDHLAIASPGRFLIVLSCESDNGRCEDRIVVTVYDIDSFLRIYAYWINYFKTKSYPSAWRKSGIVLGKYAWEFPFMEALDNMTAKLAFKYYYDLVKGSEIGKREFKDPCWAIAVSHKMAEYMDRGLRAAAGPWKEWRNEGEIYNNNLANNPDPSAWSRPLQVLKALKSLRQAMYVEQVEGLAEGLVAAGRNKCCEEEFKTWAKTAREVTGLLDEDIVIAAELHAISAEPVGFQSLNMLKLAPVFYAQAKEKAKARGWTCN